MSSSDKKEKYIAGGFDVVSVSSSEDLEGDFPDYPAPPKTDRETNPSYSIVNSGSGNVVSYHSIDESPMLPIDRNRDMEAAKRTRQILKTMRAPAALRKSTAWGEAGIIEEDMEVLKRQKIVVKCLGCEKEFGPLERQYCQYGRERKRIDREHSDTSIIDVVCFDCKSKFVVCKMCESLYKAEELKLGHCPDCIINAPRNYIRNYSFKVENNLGFRGTSQDEIFYGVELEFESEDIGLDTLIVNSLLGDEDNPATMIGVLKKDISITHGFEIVSVPATIDEHYIMWNGFFEKLPVTCKPSFTCGMHVHVSKIRMSDLHIGKMLTFIHKEENREFIRLCAGRDSSFHNDFTKIKSLKDSRVKGADRHTALNLNNENTIEFRIFASTRDRRIFLKNVEFCRGLVKFTEMGSRSIKEASDYREFMNFIFKYRKEYEYLALFFETSPLIRLRKK